MYVKSVQLMHELKFLQAFTRLSEHSFNSDRKYMAVSGIHTYSTALYSGTPREIYYIKGAIEAVLDRCKFYYMSDGSTPALNSNTRNVILSNAQVAAAKGLRTLAMHTAMAPWIPPSQIPLRSPRTHHGRDHLHQTLKKIAQSS